MWRRWSVLATTSVAVIAIQTAQTIEISNSPAETEGVTVRGEATGALTSESPEESAKQKTQISGGFTIKTADEMKLGHASLGYSRTWFPVWQKSSENRLVQV